MLASETVEALFRRLSTRYGSAWSAKWAGLPAADVMADWAKVLDGIAGDSLRYGLDYLPEFVPTAHQFRELCKRAPRPNPPEQLKAPDPTPEQKAKVRAMLAEVRKRLTSAA